jgi:hypothetical protein
MSAATLLAELTRRGVRLSAEGERLTYDAPEGVLRPIDLEQLKTHKPELIKALTLDAKAPQNEAVAMLRQHPELSHAFVTDDESDAEFVYVSVVIRDQAACKMRIPKSKYDGLKILEWLEQRTNGKPQ